MRSGGEITAGATPSSLGTPSLTLDTGTAGMMAQNGLPTSNFQLQSSLGTGALSSNPASSLGNMQNWQMINQVSGAVINLASSIGSFVVNGAMLDIQKKVNNSNNKFATDSQALVNDSRIKQLDNEDKKVAAKEAAAARKNASLERLANSKNEELLAKTELKEKKFTNEVSSDVNNKLKVYFQDPRSSYGHGIPS